MDGNDIGIMATGDRAAPARASAPMGTVRLLRPRRQIQKTLAQVLLARSAVTAAQLSRARKAMRTLNLPLSDILLAQGAVSEAELVAAFAEHHRMGITDLTACPPDPAVAALLPARVAIACDAVPWRRMGGSLVVATSQPAHLSSLQAALPRGLRVIITLAPKAQVLAAQITLYGEGLARRAEGVTPERDSCRAWRTASAVRVLTALAGVLLLMSLLFPVAATALIFGLTFLIFLSNVALKAAAFATSLRTDHLARHRGHHDPPAPSAPPLRLPVVTLIVPLFREREIASTLIATLSGLDYPPERLDVILAIEAGDTTTRDALSRCKMPPWMRFVTVPAGHPQTKPRALNFALNFARGSIVGVYDAEDRPDPDQIARVVARFHEVPPDVACLQGRLDYYNSGHNRLAGCFAVEYATWFRVLLPGVQRLGLFVPLGGTTVFLRREVLDKLGAWDAHNVTEDAELGLRLARHGYRTEVVDTTTYEEANAAVLPWIKQRSRWQKGYLMTWAAAMRHPVQLWRDLGAWRYVGFQVQVLFAVAGFLMAPLLWTLIVKPFGVPHPMDALLSPVQFGFLAVVMVASLILSVTISTYATRAPHLRSVRPLVLISELFQVLGTIAAWRAASEMLAKPFFWAKTEHGRFGGAAPETPDLVATPATAPPP